MTMATASRAPRPSSLYDVIDLILDKGLVIDAYVRVSVVGIELVTIDARVVVASVDTYLRFAEATNRLDLRETEEEGLPGMIQDLRQGGAKQKTSGAIEGVKESVGSIFNRDDDDEEQRPRSRARRSRSGDGERPRRRRRPEPADEQSDDGEDSEE